ncbi:apicoplast import protein Tic20 [Plasmodium gonderi]|uniref:Apicoplast import protein Tic20 n=1 Tax=Plasmodium gonderi TaxID=77519 RepID=A0A1Y1JHS5_PLAGO|nr:apicoplast import protein Tic20 [Plasmodium gonderi]GAW81208.1 apicoplast import protein Tic20 [Plasmodium gonderi]
MFIHLFIYTLAHFILTTNVLSFQNWNNIKIYHVSKNSLKKLTNGKNANMKNITTTTGKLFYSLNKNSNTSVKIRKSHINMSLKENINLIFHGERDITLFDKFVASTSYILPFIDAIQAFIMPLVNMLPHSLHKYLFQIEKINQIYSSIPFLSFGTFMGLYFLFVKENKFKFHYFIRYHHMQSLILSMFGYAMALFYFRVFPYSYNDTDIFNLTILYSTMTIYFGSLIIPFFSSLLGYYIEIPVISEAIKLHIGEKKKTE